MIGKDLLDLETREDLKREGVNPVATIKYTMHTKVETAKDLAAYGEQEVCNVIKEVHGEMEVVKMYNKPPKIFRSNSINL